MLLSGLNRSPARDVAKTANAAGGRVAPTPIITERASNWSGNGMRTPEVNHARAAARRIRPSSRAMPTARKFLVLTDGPGDYLENSRSYSGK